MVYSIDCCALIGLDAHLVTCEVDLSNQLPSVTLIGLPSSLTQESRDRIRAAITNSGFDWPARKITINLLPAQLPKWGSHFELAMALGVMASSQGWPAIPILAIGELSLSGQLRPSGWLAAITDWIARMAQVKRLQTGLPLTVVLHEADLKQILARVPELKSQCEWVSVKDLRQAHDAIREIAVRYADLIEAPVENALPGDLHVPLGAACQQRSFDLLSKVEQEPLGVLAVLAAIAGRHHLLLAGPQGTGKSMLAKALARASQPLSEHEWIDRESSLNPFGEHFSVFCPTTTKTPRPVVSLQTSISRAAFEGALLATGQVMPGEISRAHQGILNMDEFLEFRRDVLEALRQPLEENLVRLQRARYRTELPANFQLVATTNLCPCGHSGHPEKSCRCGGKRNNYQVKLSGPLIDRFDLIVVTGQRAANGRRVVVPRDLVSAISTLVEPKDWKMRIDRAEALLRDPKFREETDDPAKIWSEVAVRTSDRVRLKIGRVSRTLAALMNEPRTSRHIRMALLIRQDLDHLLRPGFTARIA